MASSTISAFNEMMGQFLNELVQTFPEEPAMKKYRNTFELFKDTNPRKIMETFVTSIGPYSNQIMQKDETFFLNSQIDVISDLNIGKHWNNDLSLNTKNAIWQYLQTLYTLGSTINTIPASALGQIEQVAQQVADGMGGGDGVSMSNMMSGLTGLFSSLGGGGSPLGLPEPK